MAHRSGKRLGKDAKVSVMTKYLHPSRLINEVLQNYESNNRLNNCIIVRMEEKKVNRHYQLVIVLKHEELKTNDGEPEEIYAVTRCCKVEEEGSSDLLFDTDNLDGRSGSFVSESGEAYEVPVIV